MKFSETGSSHLMGVGKPGGGAKEIPNSRKRTRSCCIGRCCVEYPRHNLYYLPDLSCFSLCLSVSRSSFRICGITPHLLTTGFTFGMQAGSQASYRKVSESSL